MKEIGDPTSVSRNGSRLELRFTNDDGVFAIVYNDCVENYSLTKVAGAVDLLELSLRAPRTSGLGLLREEAIIEMWLHDARGSIRVGLIRSEHVAGGADETGQHISIQGRSPCGHLIDESISLDKMGTLRELIEAVAPGEIDISEGVPSTQVSAYLSAPSTFGALRLLATSMALVVRDAGTRVAVATRTEVMEQIRARPVAKLTDREITKASFSRGTPLRTRE
jgi:hypothetical protein